MPQQRTRNISAQRQQDLQAAAQRAEMEARVAALNAQRGELQSQLGQLEHRRSQLQQQVAHTPSANARAELNARLAEVDLRAQRLDVQIQRVNDQVVEAMAELAQQHAAPAPRIEIPSITVLPGEGPFGPRSRDTRQIAGMMMMEAVVLALVFGAIWRFGMRRMREQFARAFADQSAQVGQLQQAVDVIGVEVERISEGQRYVAKMLTEGSPAARAQPFAARETAVRSPDV